MQQFHRRAMLTLGVGVAASTAIAGPVQMINAVGAAFKLKREAFAKPKSHPLAQARQAPIAVATLPTTRFPDASNTGVAGATVLKSSGWISVTESNTVINGLDIAGSVQVAAGLTGVVIQNCRITTGQGDYFGVHAESSATVRNCTIDGANTQEGSYGIYGSGNFVGNNICGFENGITPFSNTVVARNFIHDLYETDAGHPDGIPLHGGQSNVVIEGNTVVGRGTAEVFITNDFGPISNVEVRNNCLTGSATYAIHLDGRKANGGAIAGISITNNTLGKGQYGYIAVENALPVISGNVDATTGMPVE